jgi:hypothetical protein
MKQPIKAVMLPTEDIPLPPFITIRQNRYRELSDHPTYQTNKFDGRDNPQYLYITVSQYAEPIKDGDWCYYPKYKNPIRLFDSSISNTPFKIIASNDPKLTFIKIHERAIPKLDPTDLDFIPSIHKISQLQQSFIKEFITNPDGEWEVEYNTNNIHNQEVMFHEERKENFFEDRINGVWKSYIPLQKTLKLNQDNTVNITSAKEKMYSNKEMVRSFITGFNIGLNSTDTKNFNKSLKNWIKKNL